MRLSHFGILGSIKVLYRIINTIAQWQIFFEGNISTRWFLFSKTRHFGVLLKSLPFELKTTKLIFVVEVKNRLSVSGVTRDCVSTLTFNSRNPRNTNEVTDYVAYFSSDSVLTATCYLPSCEQRCRWPQPRRSCTRSPWIPCGTFGRVEGASAATRSWVCSLGIDRSTDYLRSWRGYCCAGSCGRVSGSRSGNPRLCSTATCRRFLSRPEIWPKQFSFSPFPRPGCLWSFRLLQAPSFRFCPSLSFLSPACSWIPRGLNWFHDSGPKRRSAEDQGRKASRADRSDFLGEFPTHRSPQWSPSGSDSDQPWLHLLSSSRHFHQEISPIRFLLNLVGPLHGSTVHNFCIGVLTWHGVGVFCILSVDAF